MAQPEMTIKRFPTACFAPPLTDVKLVEYERLINKFEHRPQVQDAMQSLLFCLKQWWELPESKRTDGDRFKAKHLNRDVTITFVPLEEEHQKRLFDLIPWDYELDAIQSLFDTIPTEWRAIRDCAFHLLWHVRELCLDREPMTQDKLPI